MKRYGWCLLIATVWTALAATAHGQEISMSAQVSAQQAAVGESIQLRVVVEGRTNISGTPELPVLPDFQVYSGGRSSNFSFVNGQVSSSLQFTYILVPKRAGTFTIGPITLAQGGQTYSTQPMTVVVGGAAAPPPGGPSAPAPALPAPDPNSAPPAAKRQAGQAVFITTSVDRGSVYVNQPLTLTFRFYSRIPVLSQPQYQPPDVSGFWSEDLPPQREYMTVLNGMDYRVIEIKTALFPSTSGKLTVGPARLTVQVEDFNREQFDPFSDSFFRNFFNGGRPVTLQSTPIAVNVKPLPAENRPADFSGTVGSWSLSARLDRQTAKVGDPVTLEVRIFGEGNVKSVGKPEWPAFTGFKVYDTVSSSDVQKQDGRVRGVKTYRTLLRPEVTGDLTLPSLGYAYFDPARGKYERIQVPGLTLKVAPGDGAPADARRSDAQPPGQDVKVVARDIRYLKIAVPLDRPGRPLPSAVWVLGFLLPPLVLTGLWAWQRWQDELAANPKFARRLNAGRRARAALKQASLARRTQQPGVFYQALSQALLGYAADQLGMSRSGSTQREILARLSEAKLGAELLGRYTALLDESDFARFAPSEQGRAAMEAHEREAESVLTELVRRLERTKNA